MRGDAGGPDGTVKIGYSLDILSSHTFYGQSGESWEDAIQGHQEATRQGGSPSSVRGADAARKLAEVEPSMKEMLESLPWTLDDCR